MPRYLMLCLLLALPWSATARLAGPLEVARPVAARDLAVIRSSGELRVLVNQSRNSSGEIKGQSIGVEYHRLRALEQFLNRNAREGHAIRLKLIPTSKDQLLGALQRGEGDLVAPGEIVSVPPGSQVAASSAIRRSVPLIVVGRKGDRRYRSLNAMAGRTVALPIGSAAGEAILKANEQLVRRHQAPVIIEWVDPTLAVEDVLEMVQAGIYPMTVVEQPIAERWAKVMPKLRLETSMVLSKEGAMRWFMRRDTPMLSASVDRFLEGYRSPSDLDATFQRVYRRLYTVHSPMGRTERKRLEKVRSVLQRHAEQNDFDWLALAALAFKESTLNPAARGRGGATGLMQITPAAARSVGVSDIAALDNNVRASAKYLANIRRGFFNSPKLNERERMAFVLAAYNLGPQRVQGMRAEARRRGLNPNQWFFQVERIALEEVGMGVVSYVNSVNKYHLAYTRERYRLEPSVAANMRR